MRTWAPVGETPVLRHHFRWKNASIIAGITARSFYFRICPGAVRAPFVVKFLKHLRRHLRRRLLVVWDGIPIHRAKEVQQFLRTTGGAIVVERLPAYAPELNPAEGIFGYLKEHRLGNYCPASIHEATAASRKALAAMRRRPALVAAFWRHAKLCL